MINLEWPQITIILLSILGLMVSTINHDKEQGKYNAYASFISKCIILTILYYGGFFTK